jgi:uncharacterized protein (DUF433 family)
LVNKTEPKGCWQWLGSVSRRLCGYGSFKIYRAGRWGSVGAHRFSYEINKGPIPAGLCVCHHCDNPLCVNPIHLFAGTPLDNSRDRKRKGRGCIGVRFGSGSPRAKLTEEDVADILVRVSSGETQTSMAKKYSVSKVAINAIIKYRTWKHVQFPRLTPATPTAKQGESVQ